MMTLELEVTAAKLTGDPARDIKSLSNHVFMLEEKLRYTLRNLDVTNFNDLGLARYENGWLQIYTKEITAQTDKLRVEFGKETDDIHALISATADELLAEIEDVEGNYTTLRATVNGLTTRVGDVEGRYSSLNQTVTGIQSTVSSHTNSITTLRSDIQQTNSKIAAVVSAVDDSSGNVTAASIVAAINGAASTVKIDADHIVLSGVVTVQDLATNGAVSINAGNIAADGTISGCALVTKQGEYDSIIIDKDSFTIGSLMYIRAIDYTGNADWAMQIANRGGPLVLGGEHVRIYTDTSNAYYWIFRNWGLELCRWNGYTDEQVGQIQMTWTQ